MIITELRKLRLPTMRLAPLTPGVMVSTTELVVGLLEHVDHGYFYSYDNPAGAILVKVMIDAALIKKDDHKRSFLKMDVTILNGDSHMIASGHHTHVAGLGDSKAWDSADDRFLVQGEIVRAFIKEIDLPREVFLKLQPNIDTGRLPSQHPARRDGDTFIHTPSPVHSPLQRGYGGVRDPSEPLHSEISLKHGLTIKAPVVNFFTLDGPAIDEALNHVSFNAAEDSKACVWFAKLPRHLPNEAYKYRTRLTTEELLAKLRTPASIEADGQRWVDGVTAIEAKKAGKSQAAVERELKALSRECNGSRGLTPLTKHIQDMRTVSPDVLHAKTNAGKLTWEAAVAYMSRHGVLEDVRAATPVELQCLFTAESDSKKRDTYAQHGGLWTQLFLSAETMLLPIAEKAKRLPPLRLVYTRLWEFFRVFASFVKLSCSMSRDGYPDQISQFEKVVEEWVQILLQLAPNLYDRLYVELIRYVFPVIKQYVWDKYHIPLGYLTMQSSELTHGAVRQDLGPRGNSNGHNSTTNLNDNKYYQRTRVELLRTFFSSHQFLKNQTTKKCSQCKQPGHYKSTCPTLHSTPNLHTAFTAHGAALCHPATLAWLRALPDNADKPPTLGPTFHSHTPSMMSSI